MAFHLICVRDWIAAVGALCPETSAEVDTGVCDRIFLARTLLREYGGHYAVFLELPFQSYLRSMYENLEGLNSCNNDKTRFGVVCRNTD